MRQLFRRILYLIRYRRLEADLAEEMQFHREMKERDLVAQGLPSSDAAFGAQRAIGNDALAANQARDVWMWPWLQDLSQDVRFAARLLIKERRFSFAAIVALALGIGANTTAFTFVNALVFRDVPLKDPDQLVMLRMIDTRKRPLGVSFADLRDWRDSARSFSDVVMSFEFTVNVSDEGIPAERYFGSYISINAFQMVGASPLLGRLFLPEDDRLEAPRVAILAYHVWQNRYASDANVIGRVIRINDTPTTVIGVMPERFQFPFATDVWQPGAVIEGPPATLYERRGNRNVLTMGFARLADGTSRREAQAEMDGITARLARDFPTTNDGLSVVIEPLDDLYRGGFRQMMLLVMGAVAFVLVIACVNVANLLLARSVRRSREIAIRASLGGTRWRIVRQLLIESALLSVVAGALGFVIGIYGVRAFASAFSGFGPEPWWMDWSMDGRVYAFLAAVCLGATMLFGLAPALHISKTHVTDVLKDGGRGATTGSRARRWTGALMVAELALTLVLLAGAGLLVRSFVAIYQAGRVLDTSNMLTMRLSLTGQKYARPELIKQFFHQLDERLQAIPSFSAVSVASDIPMRTLTNSQRQLEVFGRPQPPDQTPRTVAYAYIGPRYFETMRLRLLRGREFSERDGLPGNEGAIVNQRFVSMIFPDVDPIGQRIRLTNAAAPNAPKPWFTIVGVAPTIPQIVARDEPEPLVYVPVQGEPAPHRLASIIVRDRGDSAASAALLREEIRKIDPSLAAYFVQTMDQVLSETRFVHRVFGTLFGLLAGIALLLASVGLYALTSHGVAERTQEIGVRMALGARSPAVIWLFVRRTLVHLAIGLGVGLGGAIVAGRLLGQFLVRTAPTDPLTLAIVAVILVVVATAASVFPARRAARVDPVVALRYD